MLTMDNFFLVVDENGKVERIETDAIGRTVPRELYKEAESKGVILHANLDVLIGAITKQRLEELLD